MSPLSVLKWIYEPKQIRPEGGCGQLEKYWFLLPQLLLFLQTFALSANENLHVKGIWIPFKQCGCKESSKSETLTTESKRSLCVIFNFWVEMDSIHNLWPVKGKTCRTQTPNLHRFLSFYLNNTIIKHLFAKCCQGFMLDNLLLLNAQCAIWLNGGKMMAKVVMVTLIIDTGCMWEPS